LKPKLEALQTLVNEVTTELYKNASPPSGADETSESSKTDETKTN